MNRRGARSFNRRNYNSQERHETRHCLYIILITTVKIVAKCVIIIFVKHSLLSLCAKKLLNFVK